MYERPEYSTVGTAALLKLLAASPLALVVTTSEKGPVGTHAPVLFRRGPDGADEEAVAAGTAPLVGSVLIGHMNVKNPQWKAMRDGARALAVFQGPHGYVSPTVYGVTPAAPTWDFTAVHVMGTLRPIANRDKVFDVVSYTARRLEATFGQGWKQEASIDYFRRIACGVGAFEIQIDSVETMFKLSQEQSSAQRRRVVEHFTSSTSVMHQELAELMREHSMADPTDEDTAVQLSLSSADS